MRAELRITWDTVKGWGFELSLSSPNGKRKIVDYGFESKQHATQEAARWMRGPVVAR